MLEVTEENYGILSIVGAWPELRTACIQNTSMEWRNYTNLRSAPFVGTTGLDTRYARFSLFTALHHVWSPTDKWRLCHFLIYHQYAFHHVSTADCINLKSTALGMFSSCVAFMPNFEKICQPVQKLKCVTQRRELNIPSF
jgi:hypothetical protein